MPGPVRRSHPATVALVVALAALVVVGCGDEDKDKSSKEASTTPAPPKATTLAITTTDLGKKKFKMEAPKSIEGGLVTVNFSNAGNVPHEAQLIRLEDGHTVKDVLQAIGADKAVIPDWVTFEGGVSSVRPGQTGTATVKLAAGEYAVIDTGEGDEGPPPSAFGATAGFTVTGGDNGGEVEDTASKIEAKEKGDDDFEFVSSSLTSGKNELTFENTGKELHHVVGFPIVGNATLADVKKFLSQRGKPSGPPPVDFEKGFNTSSLDGKRKETTQVMLTKGRNALVCFLTDRDGKGKSHFQEGMLKEVDVK